MKHFLIRDLIAEVCKEENKPTPSPATMYRWTQEITTNPKYPCKKTRVKGKAGKPSWALTDATKVAELKDFIVGLVQSLQPRKPRKAAPEVKEQQASVPVSSAALVVQLQQTINAMRDMGYHVDCSYRAPERKL